MIDVENFVFTSIATAVREKFPGAFVSSEYVKAPPRFPHISIVESDNYMTPQRLDSGDSEKYSTLMYEVNVYSNKTSGKKSECREIMSLIDSMLYDQNFIRLSMSPIPNMEDASIYRITARYRVETNGEKFFRI